MKYFLRFFKTITKIGSRMPRVCFVSSGQAISVVLKLDCSLTIYGSHNVHVYLTLVPMSSTTYDWISSSVRRFICPFCVWLGRTTRKRNWQYGYFDFYKIAYLLTPFLQRFATQTEKYWQQTALIWFSKHASLNTDMEWPHDQEQS